MPRLTFTPVPVAAQYTGNTVRFDTAESTNTPADIAPLDGGRSIDGSVLRSDPSTGALPRFRGPDNTSILWRKVLSYAGTVLDTARINGTSSTVIAGGVTDGSVTSEDLSSDALEYLSGTYARRREVDPRDYGVVMNCATDSPTLTTNTARFQEFITAVVTGGLAGVIPSGEIRVNAQIDFPYRPGWTLDGVGRVGTVVKQYTDNTPIFNLGSDNASLMHGFRISDLSFDYANTQSSSNTTANPILFSKMVFQGQFRNLGFTKGSYAMRVASGIGCPWGTSWDDLIFGNDLTIGAMDWSAGVNGTPNNHFGRMTINCNNMTGPVFRIRGYNFTIDTLEFLAANNGPKLLEYAAGGKVEIGTVKVEIGSYTAAQAMFDFLGATYAKIGHLTVGGTTMVVTPSSGSVKVAQIGSGGGAGSLEIGCIEADASSQSGTTVLVGGSSPARIRLGTVTVTGGWQLTDNASASTSEVVTVDAWRNGQLSATKADADYTVALGDPTIISFQTAFTASRTVTLPSTGNLLFNGLQYRIVVDGAVNGANTLVIKAAAVTLHTVAVDNVVVTYTWRRHTTATSGWVMTGYETLP